MSMTRRSFVGTAVAGAAVTASANGAMQDRAKPDQEKAAMKSAGSQAAAPAKLKGHIKQSVCRWCYQKMPLDELAQNAAAMGIVAVDLLQDRKSVV